MNARHTWAMCMLLVQRVDHVGADGSQTGEV